MTVLTTDQVYQKKKKKVILLHSDISVSHWFKDFFTQNEVEVEQYMQFKTTSI